MAERDDKGSAAQGQDEKMTPKEKDKLGAVERTDAEGSAHVSDDAAQQQAEETVPLTAEVSPDVSEAVGEFMGQAAQQNVAAAEEIPEVKNKPGSYISFEHVYKAFGNFVVLEDVNFCVNSGETLCILGRSGVGKSVSLQMLMGFLRAGPRSNTSGGGGHLRIN